MEHNKDLVLTLPLDKLVDPEHRIQFASKVVDVLKGLTLPSNIGFAFTSHQRIELQKLLLTYETDLTLLEVYGSKEPKEAMREHAKLEASINLLHFLLNSK